MTDLLIDPVTTSTVQGIRVAILDHTAKMGGGEIALLHFVSRLDRERFDPVVILFSDGPLAVELSEAGVECRVFPLDRSVNDTRKGTLGVGGWLQMVRVFKALAFSWRLRKLLSSENVDLVHTNSLKSDVLGGLAGRLAGVPVIWHVRDRIAEDYLPKPAVWLFRVLARVIPQVVIANSNATLSTVRLPSSGREFTVYSGITFGHSSVTVHDGIPAPTNGPAEASDSFRVPTVGLVGRLSPWKGQHIFIQAAAEVLKHVPDTQFQIIGSAMFGETEYEQQIRQQVVELGLTQSVHFLGFRSDIEDLVSKMDLLVHASTTGEPFGQVIVEGMAAGRAVVATNGGGVPEIVMDGETGILVPMNDVPAMASAILKLLNDRPLMHRMGAAGRQRAADHFTIERTVARIQDIYLASIQSGQACQKE